MALMDSIVAMPTCDVNVTFVLLLCFQSDCLCLVSCDVMLILLIFMKLCKFCPHLFMSYFYEFK